jgi:ribosomal protein S18 acetylase RimI-like enzyme
METDGALFEKPLQIVSDHGDIVWVSTLSKDIARTQAETLVAIHNLIPFVGWTKDNLLSDKLGTRIFHHKWNLSLLITNSSSQPVGFLVSYLRPADDNFERVSVYMHRMAIITHLQRRGIGRQVISIYLQAIFSKLPVDHVTLQANDNKENTRIIGLYEALGFIKIKRVFYPNKIDWLMARPRTFPHHVAK